MQSSLQLRKHGKYDIGTNNDKDYKRYKHSMARLAWQDYGKKEEPTPSLTLEFGIRLEIQYLLPTLLW